MPNFTSHLTVDKIIHAKQEIIIHVQKHSFEDELHDIKRSAQQSVKRSSSVFPLSPIINEAGILCVGGRLKNAPIGQYEKHEMLLPKGHHIVNLIIHHFHVVSIHSGPEYVLALTRSRFWIIRARLCVKRILAKCVKCKRQRALPSKQKMANLPEDRVTPFEKPFTYVGVDCFGPFLVKRGRSVAKRYGCIFTCLAIRAIHIEIIHSLDMHSFINALHRFMARRGYPK